MGCPIMQAVAAEMAAVACIAGHYINYCLLLHIIIVSPLQEFIWIIGPLQTYLVINFINFYCKLWM